MSAGTQTTPSRFDPDKLRLLVRVGVFVLLVILGRVVFPTLMQGLGLPLVVSALSAFATGALANAVVARGWERGQLSDFGLGWTAASGRELLTGIALGAGGAALIVLVAVVSGMANFDSVPLAERAWGGIPILMVVLLFGSVGEELMFHGYAFQHLVRHMGEFATVLPVGILFGILHLGNQNVTLLAVVNTIAWGVLLGYAYLRTRASVAADRDALRLERGHTLPGRESQRVYNSSDGIRAALENRRSLERRRVRPGGRLVYDIRRGGAVRSVVPCDPAARWMMRRLALVLILSVASARLHADSKKLTEDQRIEILRGLSSEYAKIKVQLPRTKKILEFSTDGTWDHDVWQAAFKELGAAGRIGDLIQVTHVDIDKDRIILDLNGGMKGGKRKFMDHVQIGMGTQTSPVTGPATNAPGGTTVALTFGGPIGEVTSADVKKMLQPILDFEKETVTANYVDTLPEPIKVAVKSKKVIEGMNHDQVLLAVGKPVRKSRENKDGTDLEDWIYGEPPGRMTFVTFTGDKVVKVKETYAGLGGSVAETPQQP